MPPVEETSAAPAQESLLQTLQGLWRELPGLINDRIDILSLEAKRAGKALGQVAGLGAVAALLGLTAWFALWVAVVGGLAALGLHWSLGALVVLLVNAAAVWFIVKRVTQLLPLLQMPATRRHMRLTAPLNRDEQPLHDTPSDPTVRAHDNNNRTAAASPAEPATP